MASTIKSLTDLLGETEKVDLNVWQLRCVKSDDCQSYVAWNTKTLESIVVDPKLEDQQAILTLVDHLKNFKCVAVIDTHIHADHYSCARNIAEKYSAPLVMHEDSPCSAVTKKISSDTTIQTKAGKIEIWLTPGHTDDSITLRWGPFAFTGDTVLFGDTGRDDLPGGDPEKHFDSLEFLKEVLREDDYMLAGHDSKGGRASTWGYQLKENPSLNQDQEAFVADSLAFKAPAPALLEKAIAYNSK